MNSKASKPIGGSNVDGFRTKVWELEQQLEEWSRRSPVCFTRKFQNSPYFIKGCIEDGSYEARDGWKDMQEEMSQGKLFNHIYVVSIVMCHKPCAKGGCQGSGKASKSC